MMLKVLIGVMVGLGLLAGCNGEPTYSGVSFIAYNYTPWNLEPVELSDAFGNVASSSTLIAGGGAGSVSCCYKFSGTDFTVTWRGGDPDVIRKHLFDGKYEEAIFKKETSVHFPATEVPSGDGMLVLELHIYPDEHMELALTRQLVGKERIPLTDTIRWLYEKYRDDLVGYEHIDQLGDDLSKVTQQVWLKYRIEDAGDMRGYMYLYFLVASDFENDAEISALLKDKNRKPGEFGRAVAALSKERIEQMKASGAPPGMRANKSESNKQPPRTDDVNMEHTGAGGA